MTEIGPHLLGWNPRPPDPQDWNLADFAAVTDPLDIAMLALSKSGAAKATKAWASVATTRIKAVSPYTPPTPPAPPATDVTWADALQLDQGQTPHCVGFGWAQYGNSDPVNDGYADNDGHAIYYEAKAIDGEPGQENGSSVKSGAIAMKNRGRIGGYAFAANVNDIATWVRTKGPVVVGTNWLNDMFSPDPDGTVHVSGPVEGGHCYLLDGIVGGYFWFQNSWGNVWGLNGRFRIAIPDFASLLAAQGEACAAIELPLAVKLALSA